MESEWPTVEVREACELVVDCINNTAPTVDEQTPYKMIRTPNIEDGRLNLDDVKYVSEETYEKWTRRAKVTKGDVLLTREAPLGDVALVKENDTIFLGQRIVQFRPDKEILNSRFLNYAFLSPYVQAQIHKFKGSGSVVDHIRVPECEQIEIPLPPLEYQRKVADVLGRIDDKIDLNEEINRTLRELIVALFRSRYVKFEESNVPDQGWVKTELGEICKIDHNRIDPDENPEKEYNLYSFGAHDDAKWPEKEMGSEIGSAKYKVEKKTVLLSKLNPRIPRVWRVEMPEKDAISSTEFVNLQSRKGDYFNYINSIVECPEFKNYMKSRTTGTSGSHQRVKQADIRSYEFYTPNSTKMSEFEDIAQPFYELIERNRDEIRDLKELRQILLPKLISGEIRVNDINLEELEVSSEV